jgi:hypothetical protein
MDHDCGVWFPGFAATEFAVTSERYDMTLITLSFTQDFAPS